MLVRSKKQMPWKSQGWLVHGLWNMLSNWIKVKEMILKNKTKLVCEKTIKYVKEMFILQAILMACSIKIFPLPMFIATQQKSCCFPSCVGGNHPTLSLLSGPIQLIKSVPSSVNEFLFMCVSSASKCYLFHWIRFIRNNITDQFILYLYFFFCIFLQHKILK